MVVIGASLVTGLVAAATVVAGEAYARFSVAAVVGPRATLAVRSQPAALVISAADVTRGYLDVTTPTEVEVQSNTVEGYVLEFVSGLDGVTALDVDGLDQPVRLAGDGGSVVGHWSSAQRTAHMTLHFRFTLSPSIRPGTYSWPLHLAATPL